MSNDRETTTAGNVLLSQPVVIDNGTASIKAGFAGSSKPKVVVATKVGRTKHQRVMPGGALEDNVDSSNNQQYYCGNKLDEHRGAFYLEHPMDHGEIQSWEAMERLWEVRSILS
jgi:centractin